MLTVVGADNAFAIALFAGLTDIIPFAGGYIASTPIADDFASTVKRTEDGPGLSTTHVVAPGPELV